MQSARSSRALEAINLVRPRDIRMRFSQASQN